MHRRVLALALALPAALLAARATVEGADAPAAPAAASPAVAHPPMPGEERHLANIRQLNHLDMRWVRALGPRFDAWTQLGRDMVIIYPAKTLNSTVTIVGAKLTTELTGEDTALELPDEYHDHIISLTEIMLLAKQRDLTQAVRQLQRLSHAFKTDTIPPKLHVGDNPAMVNAGTVAPQKQ